MMLIAARSGLIQCALCGQDMVVGSARGDPHGLVLAHPRDPSCRGTRQARGRDAHVRVRLALAAIQWTPRRVSRALWSVRVRHLGNGTEPRLGPDPAQPLADAMRAAWVAFAAKGDCGWPTTT
jgi:hypothetical protein